MRKFNHEEITKDFKSGLSTKEIIKKRKCSLQTVHNILNKQGITVDRKDVRRKHFFKDNIFEKIDTQEKAYWLGFIAADGCIPEMATGRKYFSIGVAKKDICHLEKFREFLGYPDSLKLKKNGCYYLIINNMKFVNDLINLGIHPRKSLILTFPTQKEVPSELLSHFIRGYFDGDGSVYERKNYLRISICSAKTFSDKFCCNFDYFKKQTAGKIDRLCINKAKNIEKFYKYLYNNSTIWLERKRNIFENFYLEKGSEIIIS